MDSFIKDAELQVQIKDKIFDGSNIEHPLQDDFKFIRSKIKNNMLTVIDAYVRVNTVHLVDSKIAPISDQSLQFATLD
jgi:hypothetical protein